MKYLNQLKFILCYSLCATIFFSCSDDDTIPTTTNVSIINQSDETIVAQEDTLYFKAAIKNTLDNNYYWSVNGTKQAGDSIFKFTQKEIGEYIITLTAIGIREETSSSIKIAVHGKYKNGTFILNEGNMTSENGSLLFISPKGIITDSVYFKANGTELGKVSQDLFISNGKMYIISQIGRGDGILIVANPETLKKEIAFNDELASLSQPSHVVSLGNENVYIRDTKGVHSFNTSTKELKLIKGTAGALKNRMTVVNNKIFVPANKSILVLEQGKDSIIQKIEMGAKISGVIKASDSNIWVSTTGSPSKINKINSSDYSIIKTNEISEINLSVGDGATPAISAKGDTLYFSNGTTQIYRHIFTKNTTEYIINVKEHIEDANRIYNNLAVHPLTGEVYMNTIKGYGLNFLINNISVLNCDKSLPQLRVNYKDYTNFPAGIYFTYNF